MDRLTGHLLRQVAGRHEGPRLQPVPELGGPSVEQRFPAASVGRKLPEDLGSAGLC